MIWSLLFTLSLVTLGMLFWWRVFRLTLLLFVFLFLCAPYHPFPPALLSFPLRSAEPPTKNQNSKPTLCSVHPGELLRLNCPLPEAAAIIWTKDGSSLGPDNRTLIDQEWLQIRDATPKDSGLYACSVAGSKASDALCFIVNVTGETLVYHRWRHLQNKTFYFRRWVFVRRLCLKLNGAIILFVLFSLHF